MIKEKENQPEVNLDEQLGATVTNDDGCITLSLRILPVIRGLQSKHGLRHGDYQRYRGYCSRRLSRLRKVLNCVQGDRKKFVKKDITLDALKKAAVVPTITCDKAALSRFAAAQEAKHLQLPLIASERAWGYAMQLKFEMNSEPRKKFHMLNRLRKAKLHAEQLMELTMSEGAPVDAVTKLEAQAYGSWMAGILSFELSDWAHALRTLTAARNIYERLSTTFSAEDGAIYRSKMDEIVPNLRYCAYNIGDASAKQDLLNLRGQVQDHEQLDDLIRETREQQAATLQEIEWRGRKMAVKQERARSFFLRDQEFSGELEGASTMDEKNSCYESLLMDCKDAIQVLKNELIEDPVYRNRQQTNEGPVSSGHFLLTYMTYTKCARVIERNLVMIDGMKKVLSGEMEEEKGRKPVKPQDLVRLYENIIQNLADVKRLTGLDEDIEFHQEVDAKVVFYKAFRCFYVAVAYMAGQKWAESMALFRRVGVYAGKAKNDRKLEGRLKAEVDELLEAVERRQFMAHANSILERDEYGGKAKTEEKTNEEELDKMPLCDRLDIYFEDKNLENGRPNLAHFPPSFQAIPCKPLYFDLAREHLNFPNLEGKISQGQSAKGPGTGGSSGWLGGWLGGWGGRSK